MAALRFLAFAEQGSRIEVALGGIADEPVLHAVQRVTLREHRFVQHLYVGLGQRATRVLHLLDGPFHAGCVEMDVRIGGRPGQHAVEVVRELGHFYQSLPAAC